MIAVTAPSWGWREAEFGTQPGNTSAEAREVIGIDKYAAQRDQDDAEAGSCHRLVADKIGDIVLRANDKFVHTYQPFNARSSKAKLTK
jgi:hypothetical protein